MSRLRPVHLAIVAAFVAGALVTVGIVSALDGGDETPTTLGVSLGTTTPAPTAKTGDPSTTAVPTLTSTPSVSAVATVDQSRPAGPTQTLPVGTPTVAFQPGICNTGAEPAYLTKAVPALQALGNAYQSWKGASIVVSQVEMQSLRQLLSNFTSSFDAVTPLPEGCSFIHNRVSQAAKDLSDTSTRVAGANTPGLRNAWDAEYNGRTTDLKRALDLYLNVTVLTLNPRPFP